MPIISFRYITRFPRQKKQWKTHEHRFTMEGFTGQEAIGAMAIARTRDWRMRVEKTRGDGRQSLPRRFCEGTIEMGRMRRLLKHEVPTPHASAACSKSVAWWFDFDCAFVSNQREHEYPGRLADVLSRLSDSALSQLAIFDSRHLHERPAPSCRRSARRPYEECLRERSSMWSSGRLIGYQEPPVSIMKPLTKALWPSIPSELADIMPPFRLKVGDR